MTANICLLLAALSGVCSPVWDLKRDGAGKSAPFEIPAEAIRDYGSFVAEATVKFGEVKPGNGISLFHQASGDVGWALGHTYVGTAGHGHPEITLNGSFFELPHPDAPCRGASGETHTFVFKARGGIVTAYYDGRIMRRFVSAITPAVAPIVVGGPHRRACAGVEFLDVKIWGPDYDFRVPGETEKLASGYRVGKGWSVKMPFDAPKDLPRVLCMGDSISGQYLGPLETKMKGRAAFCHWVNFVTDPKLFRAESYREVAELAPYKAIFFNNGLHSTSWTEAFVSDQRVLEIYREMVRGFRAGAPQAKLVYVNTTPHVDRKAAGGPKLADTVPANVVRRLNRLAERVMKEENVKVLDAYALLGAHPEWTSDGVHWNNQGREVLADAIAAELAETGPSAQ